MWGVEGEGGSRFDSVAARHARMDDRRPIDTQSAAVEEVPPASDLCAPIVEAKENGRFSPYTMP